MRNYFKLLQNKKGFTLIELLVVIGILGILAATVLVAINPLEQLARSRDSGRAQTITGLGHAVQAYFTSQGVYPTSNATWQTSLQTAGEINGIAANPQPTGYTNCTVNVQGNYCYSNPGTTPVSTAIYARAESNVYREKATVAAGLCAAANTWIVWSSYDGKTGLLCQAAAPAATGASLALLSF